MSLWEDKTVSEQYADLRPTTPKELLRAIEEFFAVKGRKISECKQIVDIGCGPGAITTLIAQHFPDADVVGLDISQEQVDEAQKRYGTDRVNFRAHDCFIGLPFDDESVDIITANASVHWLDIPQFMIHVQRVLKPGGVLALALNCRETIRFVGMGCSTYGSEELAALTKKPLADFAAEKGAEANRGAAIARNQYKDIEMPFTDHQDFLDTERFIYTAEMTFKDYIKYMDTIAGVLKYRKLYPEGKAIHERIEKISTYIPNVGNMTLEEIREAKLRMVVPYVLRMARKDMK